MLYGGSTALLALTGCDSISKYFGTVDSVRNAILYKASEITPQVVEEANKKALEIAIATNGVTIVGGFACIVMAGVFGAITLYILKKEK